MQRSIITPKVNKLNCIKIFLNIVDYKIEEYYLTRVYVQSSVGGLNENNEIISFKDFFSISLFIK